MSAEFDNEIACKECGANLKFKPGSLSLACGYCGKENEIASEGNRHASGSAGK